MDSKKEDKIKEITTYIEELGTILPDTFDDYAKNIEKKAACERYFEKIIEAVVDLAYFIIKERKLAAPEEEESSFTMLADQNIIPKRIAEKLRDAKGMRNIIAHEYGKIDDGIVFNAVTEQLTDDVKEFIEHIREKTE
jgi:uncharacterized protein YutE (UPF0331/DUF86 family)